ncbi:hypothetical protein HHI36_020484 [Cryptolaemus montrouzieri]|uniref:Ionotropic glutamate receptor C-terminal domain-containing protein n=1 Tax=Cryptolaemus montrouzieri TaxID=559131 RepID=A0ABD2NAU6_9CUCU
MDNDTNMLKVGVNNRNNFDCNNLVDGKNTSYFEGFSVDVMNSLRDFLNVSIQFIDLEEDILTNNTENYDVIICDSIDETFEDYFPINVGRYSMLYKTEKVHFTKDIFILTFVGTLWFIFFILMVILALCLRIATVQYSKIYDGYEAWSSVEITLWAVAAACQQGLGYAPNGFASRAIFFFGYLMSYLLYTAFAAAITSLLLQNETTQNLGSITSMTTLVCLRNYDCLSGSLFGTFKDTQYVYDMDDLLNHLNEESTIIMAPEVYFQYSRKKLKSEEQLELTSIPLENIFKLGFTINHYSPWRMKVKNGLNRLRESGVLQNILSRNLLELPAKKEKIQYGYSNAAIEHVKSAVYILFYGICAAVLFLIAEHIYAFYRSKKGLINQLL